MRYVVVRPSADDVVARAFEQERSRREGSELGAKVMDVREVVDNDPASPRERTVCYAEAGFAKLIASALNGMWSAG